MTDVRELENKNDGEAPFPIRYYTVSPNKWTFQSDKIREWVESRIEGRVLNACAGKTKLEHDGEIVRNDLDNSIDADSHVDVVEIADHYDHESFDTILYDPPFSEHQSNVSYEGRMVGRDAAAKREFHKLLKPGGIAIQFGFTTTWMPGSYDYTRREVVIWNTFGRMNDWLSTVDKRMSHSIS